MLILLEGKHFILEELVVSSELSYRIPQLAIRRNTLSWSTDSPIHRIDSSIESYIHPRNRYQANQTLPVSFASECTAFQPVTLVSVRRTLTVPKVLPHRLLGSKAGTHVGQFCSQTPNHALQHPDMHQPVAQSAGTVSEVSMN